jgi:hypothetical protein
MSDGDKRGKKALKRMWSGLSACLFAEREENGDAMAGAGIVPSEEEAELAAVKAEMAGLKKELEELNVALGKYTVKALDQRTAKEEAEIARLSKKEEQLSERLIKLQEKELKLMDVRGAKRGKVDLKGVVGECHCSDCSVVLSGFVQSESTDLSLRSADSQK